MKKFALIILLAVFVGGVFVPSSWLMNTLTSSYPMLSFKESEHAWWNGRVTGASIILRGYRVFIGSVNWRYEWLSIFSGTPCAQFYSYDVLIQTEGRVCYHLSSNSVIVRELDMRMSAEEISAVSGVEIIGNFDGYIDEVVVRHHAVSAVKGNVVWKDAHWHNGEKWLSLGEILLSASTVNNDIVVHSSDVDGPIMIDLIMLFQQQQIHSIKGSILVGKNTDSSLLETLDLFANDRNGREYVLNHSFCNH